MGALRLGRAAYDRRLGLLVGIALLGSACGDGSGSAAGNHGALGFTCAPIELTVGNVPAVTNPFDPLQVSVSADFTGPDDSTVRVPAFYFQDYTRALVDGSEELTAVGSGEWRVRFTPPQAGPWQWQARVSTLGDVRVTDGGSFTCELEPGSHGGLRRSDSDPRQLVWADGTPFVAIGENLAWYDARSTFAYDDWLDKLAAHHATYIRIWMPSWAFGLEWIERGADGRVTENDPGDYRSRLDRAWQLDYVLDAARRRGIAVMLTIQNHGPFSLTNDSQWDDNPFNRANGGFLDRPHEFYTNPDAAELFTRRLRYIVARWGHESNVIWELWNEVDLADADPVDDVIAWHRDMAQQLRGLDPYGHLITTSLGPDGYIRPARWAPLWRLPEIDLVQAHLYGAGQAIPMNFTATAFRLLGTLSAFDKPVLLAEAGVDFRGPAETLASDPEHQGLHELIWSGLFAGGFGTGMTWWWDNLIDPENQYFQLDGIAALVDGIAWDEERFAPDGVAVTNPGSSEMTQAFALRGRTTLLAWIRNARNWWLAPDHSTIDGTLATVSGLASGTWRVRWTDPLAAATVETTAVTIPSSGRVDLVVPSFAQDIALRMDLTPRSQRCDS